VIARESKPPSGFEPLTYGLRNRKPTPAISQTYAARVSWGWLSGMSASQDCLPVFAGQPFAHDAFELAHWGEW
jgi:hypothetical protein